MLEQQLVLPKENTGSTPLASFSLYALLFTWYESDIIAANIRNLFEQGIERVFLIDNDSPDDTREIAEENGAEILGIYRSHNFIEAMKVKKVNDFKRKIVDQAPHDHVWILHLDADELPTGPHGMTIRAYLESLDRAFRVVGGSWINHRPTEQIKNIPGFHPLEFQPFALRQGGDGVCALKHDKHQLIRHDKHGPSIDVRGGYHWFASPEIHCEPCDSLWVHHFNYREFEFTHQRLRHLIDTRMDQRDVFAKRKRKTDDAECFWTTRYKNLQARYDAPRPPHTWRDLVDTKTIPKWYGDPELVDAVQERIGRQGALQWAAERSLLLGDYSRALEHITQYRFDGEEPARDEKVQVGKAHCLARLGRMAEAREVVLGILENCRSIEMMKEVKSLLPAL